jgi:hypothetical protein
MEVSLTKEAALLWVLPTQGDNCFLPMGLADHLGSFSIYLISNPCNFSFCSSFQTEGQLKTLGNLEVCNNAACYSFGHRWALLL